MLHRYPAPVFAANLSILNAFGSSPGFIPLVGSINATALKTSNSTTSTTPTTSVSSPPSRSPITTSPSSSRLNSPAIRSSIGVAAGLVTAGLTGFLLYRLRHHRDAARYKQDLTVDLFPPAELEAPVRVELVAKAADEEHFEVAARGSRVELAVIEAEKRDDKPAIG
ncbi:MAG: hypothetical protein M1839_004534 [Geoglossum umbratile]|nr:MAG: hypothetical protein M1839_004534 [Geoglossum umbratile]